MTCKTNLSKREHEILKLLVQNRSNKEIAAELSLSIETVRKHLKSILEKLQVKNRTEAAAKVRTLECMNSSNND